MGQFLYSRYATKSVATTLNRFAQFGLKMYLFSARRRVLFSERRFNRGDLTREFALVKAKRVM